MNREGLKDRLAYRLPNTGLRGTSGPRNPPEGGLGVGDNGIGRTVISNPR
jgi:hypothetical protein